MAEYIKFRLTAARVGVSMALLALIAGVAEKARSTSTHTNASNSALFLKLGGISGPTRTALLKLEKKWLKLESQLTSIQTNLSRNFYNKAQINAKFLKITDADKKYLKIADANANFLKITDANSEFLKIADAGNEFMKIGSTAANASELGGLPPSAFVQGKGNVVSGAASLNGDGVPQPILRTADGLITVSAVDTANGLSLVIHNAGAVTLPGVQDVSVSPATAAATGASDPTAVELGAGKDTTLFFAAPNQLGELRLQIFPTAPFSEVVTLIVSADQPAAGGPVQVVGQLLEGGV